MRSARPGATPREGTARVAVEAVLVAALVGVAAVVRWLDLWTLPIFTDEGDEIGLALRIVRDGARPLTNDDPYLGPLFNYLLAGLFWLVGPGPWLPRALMLTLGSATIAPAYLLARELALGAGADQRRAMVAGSLAGGLLAVNAGHVVVNSHVAWGNCVTPLFMTTAGWLLARAARLDGGGGGARTRRHVGWPLVLAGLAFGLALQTHPSVAALLPGVGIFVLWKRWRWLGSPWPYLAAVALLAAQAPTLLFIQQRGLAAWLGAIREKQEMYERDGALGVNEIVLRAGQELHAFGTALGGLLNDRDTPLPPLWHPALLLGAALAILALTWLWRRGQPLLPLVVFSGLLLLPLVNGKYAPLVSNVRYVMPLVIVVLAAVGAWGAGKGLGLGRRHDEDAWLGTDTRDPSTGFASLRMTVGRRGLRPGHGQGIGQGPGSGSDQGWSQGPRSGSEQGHGGGPQSGSELGWSQGLGSGRALEHVRLLAVVALLGVSASLLAMFSLAAHQDGRTNARLLASLTALERAYQPGDTVTIDRATYRDWTLTEGRLQRVFESWLDARGIPSRVVDVEDGGRLRNDLAARGGLAVLARRTVERVSRGYRLEEIAGDAAPGAPAGTGYSIVRVR